MAKQKQAKRRFLRFLIPLLLFGVVGVALKLGLKSPSSQGEPGLADGAGSAAQPLRRAPVFALPDAKGQVHKLEDYRGKVIVLHFWASWCPPCLDEIPQWVELGTALKGKPVQMIAISLDSNWEDASKILPSENLGENVLSLLDSSGGSSEAYGSFQFPETYLLSTDLRIVTKLVGPQDWRSPGFLKIIDKILSLRVQNFDLIQSFSHNVVYDKPLLLLSGT